MQVGETSGEEPMEPIKVNNLDGHYEDQDLTPCLTYTYAIATVVGEQESDRTELHNVQVPPK